MTKMNYNRPIYRTGKEVKVEEGDKPVQMRVYLTAGFQHKDRVKELGARWDPEIKLWYIHEGHPNASKLKAWIHLDDYKKFGFLTPAELLFNSMRKKSPNI